MDALIESFGYFVNLSTMSMYCFYKENVLQVLNQLICKETLASYFGPVFCIIFKKCSQILSGRSCRAIE